MCEANRAFERDLPLYGKLIRTRRFSARNLLQ
jgi:hypothetical protein